MRNAIFQFVTEVLIIGEFKVYFASRFDNGKGDSRGTKVEGRVLIFVSFVPFCDRSLIVSPEEARKNAKNRRHLVMGIG